MGWGREGGRGKRAKKKKFEPGGTVEVKECSLCNHVLWVKSIEEMLYRPGREKTVT